MQDTLLAPPAPTLARAGVPIARPPAHPSARPPAHPPALLPWRGKAPEAALLLDSEGRITDSNPAAECLLRSEAGALQGQGISQHIPGLPLSASTPGYNLAYAAFHAGQGRWLAHTAALPQGGWQPIEVWFACVRVHGMRVIALTLRPAGGAQRQPA